MIIQRPLVLAKILGAYSIGFRNTKTGRSKRHHVIIMENLLYGHHCTKVTIGHMLIIIIYLIRSLT